MAEVDPARRIIPNDALAAGGRFAARFGDASPTSMLQFRHMNNMSPDVAWSADIDTMRVKDPIEATSAFRVPTGKRGWPAMTG